MRILFDHNIPRKLRRLLAGFEVRTSREMGWDALENGNLLAAGEDAGFDVLISGDQNIAYQQNLQDRVIALVVLTEIDWNVLKESAEQILTAIGKALPNSYQLVAIQKSRRRPRKLRPDP